MRSDNPNSSIMIERNVKNEMKSKLILSSFFKDLYTDLINFIF